MISTSVRPLLPEELDRLRQGVLQHPLRRAAPYVLSLLVGAIFGIALAPVFTLFGLPRALAFAAALVAASAWYLAMRRRELKLRALREQALSAGTAERVRLEATRALRVTDSSRKPLGLLLDLGGGELAYLALAAFPTARTEWKAGDRFPPVFTFEWIPATNEVLASRPDGEPEKVSGEVRLASLSVSEEQRFARLKREALGPEELLMLDAPRV